MSTEPSFDTDTIRRPVDAPLSPYAERLTRFVFVLIAIVGTATLIHAIISQPEQPTPTRHNTEPETPRALADIQIIHTLSPSDDLGAIEADLSSTLFGSLDADIAAIRSTLVEFETKLKRK